MLSMFSSVRIAILAAAIPASIFISLAFHNLTRDHASSDEIVHGSLAIALLTHDPAALRHVTTSIPLLNAMSFPVNVIQDYCFSGPTILLLPVLLLSGPSIETIKALPVVMSALSIFLLFFIIQEIWGRKTAWVTTVLLALSPAFIHYSRYGLLTTEPLIAALFTAAVFFFIRGIKNDSIRLFCLSFFIAGFCLSIKLSAAAYYLSLLIVTAAAMASGRLKPPQIRGRLAGYTVCFLIGSGLFWYHNIITGGATLQPFMSSITPGALYNALVVRAHHFCSILKEKEPLMETVTFSLNSSRISMILFMIFWAACAGNLLRWMTDLRAGKADLRLPLTVLFFATTFLCSAWSPGSLRPIHLSLLYPFPQLMVALFVTQPFRHVPRSFAAGTSVVMVCIVIACQSALIIKYQRFYAAQPGNPECGIRSLITGISRLPQQRVVFLNTDTDEAAYFLSRGTVLSNRIALPANAQENTVAAWAAESLTPGACLVESRKTHLYATDDTEKLEAIRRWADGMGITLTPTLAVPGPNDLPLHTIYTLSR